jgi:hypothetical protein
MAHGFHSLAACGLAIGLSAGEFAPARETPPRLSLQVLVYCQTAVRHEILLRAQDTTMRVFQRAGVDVVWLDATTHVVTPSAYFVRVVANAPPASATALGFAILDSRVASVLYPRVGQLAAASVVDIGTALGDVIAHELGHLLLGTGEHSLNGIMRSEFNLLRAQQGTVFFTDDQARAIRAALGHSDREPRAARLTRPIARR